MRTVVSNTTPLSTYLRAEREELLRDLFGVVLIPQGVADELDQGKRWFGEWRERVPWVQIRSIQPSPLLDLLSSELDRGESEAISLAVECKADILLMDEAAGRQKSRELKLEILGSIGVAMVAGRRGLLSDVFPTIVHLRDRGWLWICDSFLVSIECDLNA